MQKSFKNSSKSIQQYIKLTMHHNQVRFIPGVQVWFNNRKLIQFTIRQNKGGNYMIISINAGSEKHLAFF